MTHLLKLYHYLLKLLSDDAPLGRISRQRAERIAQRVEMDLHPVHRGDHWRN